LKMVNIGDVETLQVIPDSDTHYRVDLPDRNEVYDSFQ